MTKLINWLFYRFNVYSLIVSYLNKVKIDDSYNQVVQNNSFFYEQAHVVNLSHTKNTIKLGSCTHVRGELLVFPYGGEISIGDYCYVGEGTRIWSGASVVIGNNVLISHNVNIIDTNSHELDHLERAEGFKHIITKGHPTERGNILTAPIAIGDHAWISFNASILKGVTVGEGAIVAAGAVVTKDVPPWTIVAGNPANVVKKMKL